MTFKLRMLTAIIVLAGLSATIDGQNRGPDWTQWRGQNRDGAVTGFSTPASWPENLVQKWKVDVGLGYASPIVVGNRLYMFSRQGGDEVMSGLDVDTGKVVWRTGYPVTFTMHSAAVKHGMGPKSTPTFSGGRLFSLGMTGVVTVFDANTGKQLWQKPGSEPLPLYTSHSFSPLVDRGPRRGDREGVRRVEILRQLADRREGPQTGHRGEGYAAVRQGSSRGCAGSVPSLRREPANGGW